MENKLAIISIVVKDSERIEDINKLLHNFRMFIKARLGLPYESRGLAVICLVLDAPNDTINSLTGKLGMINGVKAKTLYE